MQEMGQCRKCGGVFAIEPNSGHFLRNHGPRAQRCRGRRELAVGYGKPPKTPADKPSRLGKW